MTSWEALTLILISISVTGAYNVPTLSTPALLKGIADIPHFVLLYHDTKIPRLDSNGR